jgi:hypothetical protein
MASLLFRIGTLLALAAAIASAGVSNRNARSEPPRAPARQFH